MKNEPIDYIDDKIEIKEEFNYENVLEMSKINQESESEADPLCIKGTNNDKNKLEKINSSLIYKCEKCGEVFEQLRHLKTHQNIKNHIKNHNSRYITEKVVRNAYSAVVVTNIEKPNIKKENFNNKPDTLVEVGISVKISPIGRTYVFWCAMTSTFTWAMPQKSNPVLLIT